MFRRDRNIKMACRIPTETETACMVLAFKSANEIDNYDHLNES